MAACPVCCGERTRPHWADLPDRLFRATTARFAVHRCVDCRTLFIWPVPTMAEQATFYPEAYWIGPSDRERDTDARTQGGLLERYRRFVLRDHVRFVRAVLDDQRRAGKPIAMVDIGCGDGSFLEALGERGAIGMDLSKAALRAVERRGFQAIHGTLDDCPLTPGTFSLVTSFHFLEHVRPIEPVLDLMRRLLAPGGELVVQVPNAASLQAKLLGRKWGGYDVPRHLVNYTAATLRATLSRCGFDVVAENHHCLRDNPTTLANSLVPALYPPSRLSRQGGRDGSAGAFANLAYLAVTLASLPLCVFESLLGRGASVMVRARPR